MLKQGLWAGLLGALSGVSLLMLHALIGGTSRTGYVDLSSLAIPFLIGSFPGCFGVGLLVALLVNGMAARGVRRVQLALVALPAGSFGSSPSRRTGAVCTRRPGIRRDSVKRKRQICATWVPVVMWTR